ncbi:hypothetical protein [Coleofasciculus sp. H7-2]|uniref:hypothetical protein n=1 Tax=Coleofasciculus sp. H7-2 TaxID=3351545 RepID=UPI00366EEB7A
MGILSFIFSKRSPQQPIAIAWRVLPGSTFHRADIQWNPSVFKATSAIGEQSVVSNLTEASEGLSS